MTQTLYRGGELKDGPSWWTPNREYAEFYGETIHEIEAPSTRVLDLTSLGVDPDMDKFDELLESAGVAAIPYEDCDVHATVEMDDFYEAAFRAGYYAIRCLQEHVRFDDEAQEAWFVEDHTYHV